jgi:uncharacterized protein (TIGR02588 family)
MAVDRKKRQHTHGNPVSERVAAAVGLVLLVGAVGYIIYDAWRSDQSPPAFVVSIESVEPVASGYRVQFRAQNVGATAAKGVTIEARSASSRDTAEVSHTTLDYLPGGATRRGALFFRSEVRAQTLLIRALGYEEP